MKTRGHIFYIFANRIMSGLGEDRCGLSASVLNLWWYIILVEAYETKKILLLEMRSILLVFPDNCGYSSWTLYQNSMISNFLKVNCKMESKPISTNVWIL